LMAVREKDAAVLEIRLLGVGDKNAHYLSGPHKSVTPATVFLNAPCLSFFLVPIIPKGYVNRG
jgi:hypothetical protein